MSAPSSVSALSPFDRPMQFPHNPLASCPALSDPCRDRGNHRRGSKTEKVLDLLKRSGGATLKDIMKAAGWQAHSVRGFLSGTIGKKMGLTVKSAKSEDGET